MNKSGKGPWPEERARHAACCLNYGKDYPQILLTGGRDRHDKPLTDAWILDVDRKRWRKVSLIYYQVARNVHICGIITEQVVDSPCRENHYLSVKSVDTLCRVGTNMPGSFNK